MLMVASLDVLQGCQQKISIHCRQMYRASKLLAVNINLRLILDTRPFSCTLNTTLMPLWLA